MKHDVVSSLSLKKLVFDEISFKRIGFKNAEPIKSSFQIRYARKEDLNLVTIVFQMIKKDEYEININMTGYFTLEGEFEPKVEEQIIKLNTVSIMLPYLRAQVSIITSQPDTEVVVLPILNVESIIDERNRVKDKSEHENR